MALLRESIQVAAGEVTMSARYNTWHQLATGAALASAAIIAATHVTSPKPVWLYETPGWTIYPPLSALPQAIPNSGGPPDFFEYMMYGGMLRGALVAAGLALIFWLLGLISYRRIPPAQRPRLKHLLLPLLGLLPTVVHVIGSSTAALWYIE